VVVRTGDSQLNSHSGERSADMSPTVAVVGRFQPFHWGHFDYLTEASLLGQRLVIGIANPSKSERRFTHNDIERTLEASNPFSFEERRSMITLSLARTSSAIVVEFRQCDLRSSGLVRSTLGHCDVVALTTYDDWGCEKRDLLLDAGYNVRILWTRSDKIVSGTEIRRRIVDGLPWRHLVPCGSANVIEDHLRDSKGCL
jgi:cytidyltransferase-like protein